jgi:hypothetical protein
MDIIDHANDRAEELMHFAEQTIRAKAAEIPAGEPGDCDFCGEPSGRLVGGACAFCRDKYHLE